MRKIALLLCSVALFGGGLKEVIEALEKNHLVEAKRYEVQAKEHLVNRAQGANYPTVDASFDGIWLKEQPTITLKLPNASAMRLPMGKKRSFRFEAAISYPLFSGFAITKMIEKSRYEAMAARLRLRDLKRNLALEAVKLYGGLYANSHWLRALEQAKEALKLSYKKAQGFFEQGLVPRSDVANIEAKLYEIEAQIEELRVQKEDITQAFFYLVGFVPKVATLKEFALPSLDFSKRADIEALKQELLATKSEVGLAKSSYYPQVGLKVAWRRFGDTLALSGDGIRNGDESYFGLGVRYNLYNGGRDKERLEATKALVLAKESLLRDYIQRVKRNIAVAKSSLEALQKRFAWALKELEAKREYRALVEGRYDNQLASADELSRAIADEAAAMAKKEELRSKIFIQKYKILLLHSFQAFKEAL